LSHKSTLGTVEFSLETPMWGKPAKEGFLLRLLRKNYSKNSSEISTEISG